MKGLPTVTIVLPVHQAEATVGAAIASCLAQSRGDYELVVVLDGCRDGSEEVVRSFSDPRIKIIATEQQGVARAATEAISSTDAPLILRMDADDISRPTRLEKQVEALECNADWDGVTGQVELITPQGEGMLRYVDWVNALTTPEDVARERFVECPLIQPSLMVRRTSFRKVDGYREVSWAEDHDLFLRMLENGMRFGKADDLVLSWRDSPGRLTRTHSAYAEDEVWKMKAHHLAQLESVQGGRVAICGAGPIGKRLARLLRKEGVEVQGFFEVNPRRVGEMIGGVPVAGPDEFGKRWREATLLSAVGVPGGRERVREAAASEGYHEGQDFWCCC